MYRFGGIINLHFVKHLREDALLFELIEAFLSLLITHRKTIWSN
jgi:hypothetical protein